MATIINPKTLKGFIAFFSLVLLISLEANAQNEVAIGSATTKSNAILWLNGNKSQGLILPYVTSKSAVSGPDKGMIVYDESDNKVWYRSDNAWVEVGGSEGGGAQSLNLQLTGNQLQLRDGTTTLSTVNIAGGTQTNGGFMVFTGGSWQYAALSGDVTGTNGALLVDGIKGKTLPALPTTTQALIYDGTAWKFQTLTVGTDSQDLSLNSATNTLSLTNDATPVDLTPYKQNLTLTGTTLGISGGNTVTLPASGSGTVTSVSAGNGLAGGTITTAGTISIASGGVGATELADNAVVTNKIQDNAVTISKINNSAVDNTKLADNAVTNTKIASGANIDISKLNGGAANNNKVLKVIGGVVTYADDEIGGTGDITDVIAGTGLTGGANTGAATLSLSNTGVAAGTYGTTTEIPRITVDAQGRVSGVTTVAPSVADGSITGGTAGPGVKIAASTITDANILSLNAGKITAGTLPVAQVPNLDASKITTGTFTAARIPNLDASKITTGAFATTQIPDLDAAKITSGVIPTTLGGTGLSFSAGSINQGQLLIGTGGAFAKANLTAGNGINITNGAGSITIATSGNFGSQNLTTSGTLNAGATTVTGLTIGSSVWPANASGVLTNNGSGTLSWAPAGGGGTVTSVGLAMPAIFTVANSPVTTSGTLTATLASQPAATIFAAPAAAAGAPAFRALNATDIPNLSAAKITAGILSIAIGGTGLTAAPTNGQLMIGNGTGYGLSTLTAGTGVNIVNGTGTITISATGLANPMTAPGDIIYGGAAGAATRLATGVGFLKGGATPSYAAIDLATSDVTGVLPLTNGGTGSTTAAGARTSLGLGALSILSAVSSTEITDGTITNIDILNVDAAKITTGTLPVARGGTNATAIPTNGGVSYGTGTAYAFTSAGISGQLLQSNGAAAPTWVNPFTNPMTSPGDIIIGGVAGDATRLASPGAGRAILGYNGTTQTWVTGAPSQLLGTDVSGNLTFINQSGFLSSAVPVPIANGGTNAITAAGARSNLGLGALATLSAINLAGADVTGILPVASGGTGRAAWDGLLFGSAGTLSDISTGTAGQILKVTGTTPSWQDFIVTGTDLSTDISIATTGNISTTGNLTAAGATTFSTLAGSGTQMVVVDNAGLIGKQALPTGFSTLNTIPKGDGTTGQIASQIYDNGTNVGIGTTTPKTKFQIGQVSHLTDVSGSTLLSNNIYDNGGTLQHTTTGGGSVLGLESGKAGIYVNSSAAADATFGSSLANRLVISETGVSINKDGADPSAVLHVVSQTTGGGGTPRGFMMPSLIASDRDAIPSPLTGLMIFNQTTNSPNYYDGTSWQSLISGWGLTGNTLAGTERIGSDNAQPLVFETSNTERMRIDAIGNVGIGTTTPGATLHAASLGNRIVLVDGSNAAGTWYEMRNTSAGGQIFGMISTGSGNGEGAGKLLFTKNNTLGSSAGNFMTFDWATANVGIGTSSPTARLDIAGTIKITDGTQANGRVLTSDANGLASWQPAGAGSGWTLLGNGGTNATTNFIGTTDNIALNFRVNNQRAGVIQSDVSGQLANLGLGYLALTSNTAGDNNVAIGTKALQLNTTAPNNTAVGRSALLSSSTGFGSNTAIGSQALTQNTTGYRNTAIGYLAGATTSNPDVVGVGITTGNSNTFIGSGSGPLATATISNSTAIGANSKVDVSNKIRLGSTTVTVIEGQVSYSNSSDRRLKQNIKEIEYGLDFIKKLKPVSYKMKNLDDRQNWGFIAQDIEGLVGTTNAVLTVGEDSLRTLSLRYTDFIAPMVKAMQEQQSEIEQLKAQLKEKESKVTSLEGSVSSMRDELDEIKRALGIQSNPKTNGKK